MTKKLLLTISALFVLTGLAHAQLDPFFPLNPATIGRGGSFTADGRGYNAFFYNPAGFAEEGEFTLLSINGWAAADARLMSAAYRLLTGQEIDQEAFFKGVASRATLPPEFDALVTSLDPFISFFGDAATALDDTQMDNAVSAILADPAVSGLLLGAIDPATVTDVDSLIAVLDLAALVGDPSAIGSALQVIVAELVAQGVADPGFTTEYNDVSTAFEDALIASASALPSGNLDVGLMLGIGWTGQGLGLGFFVNTFAIMRTPEKVGDRDGSILDANARVFNTITLAGGLGFKLTDDLALGAVLRPTVLTYGDISPMALYPILTGSGGGSDPLSMLDALIPAGYFKSFYMGLDVGATLDLGSLRVGATVKDLLPVPLAYSRFQTSTDLIAAFPFQAGTDQISPEDAEAWNLYNVPPMKLNLGVLWNPDLGALSGILDPTLGLDLFDVAGFVRYAEDNPDPSLRNFNLLKHIGVGANLKVVSIIHVNAGLYQGDLTGGLGLDLPLVKVSVAGIARNLAFPEGQMPTFREAGLSFEVALRL